MSPPALQPGPAPAAPAVIGLRQRRLTIGMPIFNAQRYVGLAIESLLGQSFGDFELLISDNASTDNTRAICEDATRRDPRVRYLRNETNLGAARNYNRLVHEARSPFFKWAAHDDLHAPEHLARCMEAFDAGPPDLALVFPRTILIDAQGAESGRHTDNLTLDAPDPCARMRELVLRLGLCNAVFGVMRLDALKKTRLHGSYISADRVLLMELALQGKFLELPDYLFLRRLHEAMSTRANATPAQLSQWFDTSKAPTRHHLPRTRLVVEHLSGVAAAPLPLTTKLRCLGWVGTRYVRRNAKIMLKELGWASGLLKRPAPAPAAPAPTATAPSEHPSPRPNTGAARGDHT